MTASGAPAVTEELKEVNANGEILMPLIGSVKCEGMTVVDLQEKIKTAYKDYFIDPQVTVGFVYVGEHGDEVAVGHGPADGRDRAAGAGEHALGRKI